MDTRTQHGFTLYELLITVMIVGIVLAFSIPNMQAFTQNSRMTSTANDLHSAFHLARSESSRAKTNITICASAKPMEGAANCGGTWDQGYIVFVDQDGDLDRKGQEETVLRAQPAIAEGVSFAVANDATYFSYSSTGLGRPNVGGKTAVSQIVMCDERGNVKAAGGSSAGRLFVATPLGRATILRDQELIGKALTEMGKSCP
ncbi:MAG: GspH/FimT family pseudopilin [Gammaproteobacteria bacterium]|nr:GspH/FimT family pseudopilin [Gammaproteobacteria bacterium]